MSWQGSRDTSDVLANCGYFDCKTLERTSQISGTGSSIAAKWYVRLDTKEEYFVKTVKQDVAESVAALYPNLPTSNGAVRPATLVHAGQATLVYAWVPGKPLREIMLRRSILGLHKEEFAAIFSELGRWLCNYHKSVPVNVDKSEYVRSCFSGFENDELKFSGVPIAKTYNDFTLRNMIVNENREVTLVDLDAAFHPSFPWYMYPYHDLSNFTINLLSWSKLPYMSVGRLKPLLRRFLQGYFEDATFAFEPKHLLYFMQSHYNGKFRDRTLADTYQGFLNRRYVSYLGRSLAGGAGGFLSNL